jgi:hypothetical protein
MYYWNINKYFYIPCLGICGLGECITGHEEIECKCKVGTLGKRCERTVEITEPYFSSNSFLAYPAPTSQQKYWEQILFFFIIAFSTLLKKKQISIFINFHFMFKKKNPPFFHV